MFVQFENAIVDVWKLRKGTVVMYESNLYYIHKLGLNFNGIGMEIQNAWETVEVAASDCTWLEPL